MFGRIACRIGIHKWNPPQWHSRHNLCVELISCQRCKTTRTFERQHVWEWQRPEPESRYAIVLCAQCKTPLGDGSARWYDPPFIARSLGVDENRFAYDVGSSRAYDVEPSREESQTGRFWLYEFPDGVRRARGTAIEEALKRGDISNRDIFFPRDTSYEEIREYLAEKGLDPSDLEFGS